MNSTLYLIQLNILLFVISFYGCGDTKNESDSIKKLQIETEGEYLFLQTDDPLSGTAEPLKDDKVIAYSYVKPGITLEQLLQLQNGDSLSLSLDENLTVDARVQRVQEILEIYSITALIAGEGSGQLVLTVEDNKIRGSVTLFNPLRYFQIRYHSGADLHYIAELDREKMDILPGSSPPETPGQN